MVDAIKVKIIEMSKEEIIMRLEATVKSLDKQNNYDELQNKIKKLEIKNQQLKELIKELKK